MLAESHVTIQALLTNLRLAWRSIPPQHSFRLLTVNKCLMQKVSAIDVVEDGIRRLQSLVTRSTNKGRQKVENA